MLYRDVQYIIPFLVQLWMFVSPVIYPIEQDPAGPLRVALRPQPHDRRHRRLPLGAAAASSSPGGYLWISLRSWSCCSSPALFYFKRMERVFADVV